MKKTLMATLVGAAMMTGSGTMFAQGAGKGADKGKAASGISGGVVKIGVITDMSGLYADLGGEGSVTAARMAAEEFGNRVAGVPIEVVGADHQNKPDVGANKIREWYDKIGRASCRERV